ncbi:unnamed protein product, partial [Polarella glacialis]
GFHGGLLAFDDRAQLEAAHRLSREEPSSEFLEARESQLPVAKPCDPLPAMDDPLAVVNALHKVVLGAGLHA